MDFIDDTEWCWVPHKQRSFVMAKIVGQGEYEDTEGQSIRNETKKEIIPIIDYKMLTQTETPDLVCCVFNFYLDLFIFFVIQHCMSAHSFLLVCFLSFSLLNTYYIQSHHSLTYT